MNFVKQVERISKAHKLIVEEKTGTPKEFAYKLKISRSQLYNLINNLKEYEAPIKYNKKTNTFYYANPFDLILKFSLKVISEDDEREIFGGFNFRAILLDGSIFNLHQQDSSPEITC